MLFFSASAMGLIFALCGMLFYRLGVSDGITMIKNAGADGLFAGSKEKKKEEEDWQSIISYDHKNKI